MYLDEKGREDVARLLDGTWWLGFLRIAGALTAAVLILSHPGLDVKALVRYLGYYLALDGAAVVIRGLVGLTRDKWWHVSTIQGGAELIVGAVITFNSGQYGGQLIPALTLAAAVVSIMSGTMDVVRTVRFREAYPEYLAPIRGVMSLVIGVFCLTIPFGYTPIRGTIIGVVAALSSLLMALYLYRSRQDLKAGRPERSAEA